MLEEVYYNLNMGRDILYVAVNMEAAKKAFNEIIDDYDFVDRHNFSEKFITSKSDGSIRFISAVLHNDAKGRECQVLVIPSNLSEEASLTIGPMGLLADILITYDPLTDTEVIINYDN